MQSVALNQLTLLNENLYNRKFKKLDKTTKLNSSKKSLYNRMMLSYFNIGVQQEHLKRYGDSEVSYNRSRTIASIINDKGILKRLTKTQSMHNPGKGTSNSLYDKSQYSNNNNSKLNMNSMRSNSKDQSNYPNFSLYNSEISEIK
jgi:hypothetical protein